MNIKGIDISTWQGSNVDFNALKKDGIQFVILRAGFGSLTSQKDNQFENNYKKAVAAGMPVGAYWYSYATTPERATAEAKTCLECIKGKKFDYPIYFDIEDPSQSSLSKSVITQMVINFCETMENAGYFVGVYSMASWFKSKFDRDKLSAYTWWIAQWSSTAPSYSHDMWQYTSDGTTSGTPGRTDMNWCYRDFPSEIRNAGLNGFSKGEETVDPPTPSVPDEDLSNGLKVGDTVKVNKGAKTYNGGSVASFVYNSTYRIDELVRDRAVLDKNGLCTAFKTSDLKKSSGNESVTPPSSNSSIKKGDKVKVVNPVVYGTNNKFATYYDEYDVLEVSGDRVVIGIGTTVTAAISVSNLSKVGGSSATTLKKGDRVMVKSGSKWYDGQGIPSWVFKEKLYVRSDIFSDNTVNVSTLSSGAITGRTRVNNLTKV